MKCESCGAKSQYRCERHCVQLALRMRHENAPWCNDGIHHHCVKLPHCEAGTCVDAQPTPPARKDETYDPDGLGDRLMHNGVLYVRAELPNEAEFRRGHAAGVETVKSASELSDEDLCIALLRMLDQVNVHYMIGDRAITFPLLARELRRFISAHAHRWVGVILSLSEKGYPWTTESMLQVLRDAQSGTLDRIRQGLDKG